MIFIYVLKLIERLQHDDGWTSDDERVVNAHFVRLQSDTKVGKVIHAGRTIPSTATGFGIVIFHANDSSEALHYMNTDPCVIAHIMTTELFEYKPALWSDPTFFTTSQ